MATNSYYIFQVNKIDKFNNNPSAYLFVNWI